MTSCKLRIIKEQTNSSEELKENTLKFLGKSKKTIFISKTVISVLYTATFVFNEERELYEDKKGTLVGEKPLLTNLEKKWTH